MGSARYLRLPSSMEIGCPGWTDVRWWQPINTSAQMIVGKTIRQANLGISRRRFLKALGLSALSMGTAGLQQLALQPLQPVWAQQLTELNDLRPAKVGKNKPTKAFAANLWFLFDFGHPSERYNYFLTNGVPSFKMFIESILFHDQVVIPTQDFMILQLLRSQLPEHDLIEMLESDFLHFLRFRGALAYCGGIIGKGIIPIGISDKKGVAPKEMPFSASSEEAIEWAISVNKEKPNDPKLLNLVLEKTEEIEAKSVVEHIRHETYKDVLNSNYLRKVFCLEQIDINQLPGLDHNQTRIVQRHYAPKWQGDVIDVVLTLAQANLEIYLALNSGCSDSSTASPVGHLFKAKAERIFAKNNAFQDFATLKEVTDIPDIGAGVLQKNISVKWLLKLRQSTNGEQFRSWFHQNCRDNPLKTAKEIISLFTEVPTIQSVPMKVLRFIVTSLIPPPFSLPTGAIDSFLVDRIFRGNSPKYFIENLQQLKGKPSWFKT